MSSIAVMLATALFLVRAAIASGACASVVDASGLPLQRASILAINLATSKVYTGVTGEDGRYCFPAIPQGSYSFEAGEEGFLNVRYYPVRITPADVTNLEFKLPFGQLDLLEGSIAQESVITGTLLRAGIPIVNAELCVLDIANGKSLRCGRSDDLGEYALSVPLGVYDVEVTLGREGEVHPLFPGRRAAKPDLGYKTRLDVSLAGIYRNRIAVPQDSARK